MQDGAHSISSVAVRWVGSLVAPLTVVAVDAVVGVLADVVLCGGKHGAQNLDVFLSPPLHTTHGNFVEAVFGGAPNTHQMIVLGCLRVPNGQVSCIFFFNPRRYSK